MTIGIIRPPFLRRAGERLIYDPAEVEKTSGINNYNQFSSKRNRHSSISKAVDRSRTPFSVRKEVSFFNQVTVVEVERVFKKESRNVWYTMNEMDQFRSDASKDKERRRIVMKRSANSAGHIRRILLQQRASQELDGAPTDPEYLSMIATDSSKKSRRDAHTLAEQLAKEIEVEVYSQVRATLPRGIFSQTSPSPLSKRSRVEDGQVTDFYWGAVFDAFTDTMSCGIPSI
jgi:hypothetical protein